MRRSLLICVLMMTLSLSACGGGGGGSEAEELALTIRGEYLAMTSCAAQAVVTADYGQRVYRYELSAAVNGEEALLTLTAPETVAGLTARIEEDEGWLEYDGAILETGELAPGGLTPMGAIPALLEKQVQSSVYMEETARSGYLDTCVLEELGEVQALRVVSRDPEEKQGSGTETTLWFDAATHALVRGEISQDGVCVLQCEFSQFTKE